MSSESRWYAADGFIVGTDPLTGTLTTTQSLFPTTVDDVPDDISTTVTLPTDGTHVTSTIDNLGDQDFFRVDLEAGVTYEISQLALIAGASGIPLADAYIEIYDANGNLLASADGGGQTPSGELYGLDAMLTFRPDASGVYYLNARAFDQTDLDGSTTGDAVGDYELFVNVSTYEPYYDVDNPLHSIDWGSQVDGSSRNPDGQEGPRITGNPFTGHGYNPYGIEGKTVITYYFAKQGDIFIDEDLTTPGTTDTMIAKGFEDWEKQVYLAAFAEYEKVADIIYVEVDDRTDADFVLITYAGTPGTAGTPSLLGRMSPPGEENEGRTEFNANDIRWTPEGLAPGGFSFTTLIHELGHGHGLAHPHDNGGRSSIMRGVQAESETSVASYTLGDFDLNQSVYTMMSYQDGWQLSPYGQAATTDAYGWLGGLMAFDIAAIQDKYGVNEEWATGDDVYILKDENAPGTFYYSIWDAGGIDEIAYHGARDTHIDLRAATLSYEYGGGGWISYAWGVYGGFTIADGVTIENATSGDGKDVLIGNDTANRLSAGGGDDNLSGGAGHDTLIGGLGKDRLDGGIGNDVFRFETLDDSVAGAGRDVIVGFANGDLIDFTALGATTFVSTATFGGTAGEVRVVTFAGATIVELDADGDGDADLQVELDRAAELGLDDFVGLASPQPAGQILTGTASDDLLQGGAGDDSIDGRAGRDTLIGGGGIDWLIGGSGRDLFVFQSADDSQVGAADTISDFARGSDDIDLRAIDAIPGTEADDRFSFIGRKEFSGKSGELRFSFTGDRSVIEADLDGDRLADLQIVLEDRINLSASDFIL